VPERRRKKEKSWRIGVTLTGGKRDFRELRALTVGKKSTVRRVYIPAKKRQRLNNPDMDKYMEGERLSGKSGTISLRFNGGWGDGLVNERTARGRERGVLREKQASKRRRKGGELTSTLQTKNKGKQKS